MEFQDLEIYSLKQRVYTWGSPEKPLILMLHGWLDTGASFDFVASGLEDQYYLVAPDMRGFGQSDHAPNPLGYFFMEYVADLVQLADHFSPQKPFILLGHSLGGAATSVFAGSFPQRLSHFLNLEGFGFPRHDFATAPHRFAKWIKALKEKPFPFHPDLKTFAERLRERNPRLSQERALFLAQYLSHQTPEGVQMTADPKHLWPEPYPFPVEAFFSYWDKITAPCLLVTGDDSEWIKYFPPGSYEEELARREEHFPEGSQLVTLKDCGHMLHHDQPEALAKAILDFLT